MSGTPRSPMRRSRARRAAVIAAVTLLLGTSVVRGHYTEWVTTSEAFYVSPGFTTFTSGDTIRARFSSLSWNTTRTSNMNHQEAHGYRFTADTHDLSANVSATLRRETTLPSPYFDRDFDGLKCEEAEITVEGIANFPVSGQNYTVNFYYTHWFWFGGWIYDWPGGQIQFSEQLSEFDGLGDKWDVTTDYSPATRNNLVLGNVNYPNTSVPGGQPPAGADPCESDGGPAFAESSAEAAPSSLETGFEVIEAGASEVQVLPDVKGGVSGYGQKAARLARALVANGPGTGVITFSEPVGRSELLSLMKDGLQVHEVEAVSQEIAPSVRLTYANAYGTNVWREMDEAAEVEGTEMLGVVSVTATVETIGAFDKLANNSLVAVIDMSPEQIRRSSGGDIEAGVDDLYWELAGWAD